MKAKIIWLLDNPETGRLEASFTEPYSTDEFFDDERGDTVKISWKQYVIIEVEE